MSAIKVSTIIDSTPDELWGYIKDISTHVDWMADAESITFTSESKTGAGTTFDCVTKVGPIKLTDKMTITSWIPAKAMGVTHSGIVTGVGEFTLEETNGNTLFTWEEELQFPIVLGGKVGAWFARPILKLIWKRNLSRLAKRYKSSKQ